MPPANRAAGSGPLDERERHGLASLPPHLIDHAIVLVLGDDSCHPLAIEHHRSGDRPVGPLTIWSAHHPESEGVEVSAAVASVDQRRGERPPRVARSAGTLLPSPQRVG
jgi:hypothetical protein